MRKTHSGWRKGFLPYVGNDRDMHPPGRQPIQACVRSAVLLNGYTGGSAPFALLFLIALAFSATGCTSAAVNLDAPRSGYCFQKGHGGNPPSVCTPGPLPSLGAELRAKRFVPVPSASTLYVVRNSWADPAVAVELLIDGRVAARLLPQSFVRVVLPASPHEVSYLVHGLGSKVTVEGTPGGIIYLGLQARILNLNAVFDWQTSPQEELIDDIRRAKLVADIDSMAAGQSQ